MTTCELYAKIIAESEFLQPTLNEIHKFCFKHWSRGRSTCGTGSGAPDSLDRDRRSGVYNHPCMYIVPNVRGKVCNCHHARRSSLIFQCTGMGTTLQSQQVPFKTLDMNGWTHSSF